MVKDNSYGIAPLQDKMLDILKHFISACQQNELKYCVTGGTCLGVFRHQGFIPWDDDLDVLMPRPDYEKLWQIYDNSKEQKYKLCRTTPEKNYHHRVMQMVDVDTTFINKRSQNEDIEHGVYIDIIPLDVCPSSPFRRISQIVNSILFSVYNIQNLPEFNGGRVERFAVGFLLNLIKKPSKRIQIWQNAEKRMLKCNRGNCSKVVCLTASFKHLTHPYPAEWFEINGRFGKFEDITVSLQDGAEKFLANDYGDYAQLPPVNERHPRHNTVFIDLENSYTKYKGQYYCVENDEKQGSKS